jgi:glycosyltransferase involved in cell wall biosynthesis
MPCLNEAETLAKSIEEAMAFLETRADLKSEILIADNGSTDGSLDIAAKYAKDNVRVEHIKNKGYGNALKGGTKAAHGKYIIMGDPDNSYDFLHLNKFIDKLQSGDDLVMGNRFKGGIEPGAMPPLHRYLGTPVLSFIGRIFYHNKIGDFNCGLRGFNRDRFLKLNLQTSGMEFASEMIVKASLSNYKISEVPTVLRVDGRSSRPHLSTWTDGWRHLRFLLMYSPKWLFLYPGLIATFLGLIGMLVIAQGQITIDKVNFDINTMLFLGGLTIIGIQLIFFSLFTYIYAINTNYLPIEDKLNQRLEKLTIEKGIMIGILLFVIGFVMTLISIFEWKNTAFSNLNPLVVMKLTIPAMILMVVGIQIIFSSFFAGILKVKRS